MTAEHEDHAALLPRTPSSSSCWRSSSAPWRSCRSNWTWSGGFELVVVGAVVGKVMSMMGMGKQPETADH
ncbi:MAG: hypothetical protein U0R68_11210 [Candidatus Nanopelagicales bacterium]